MERDKPELGNLPGNDHELGLGIKRLRRDLIGYSVRQLSPIIGILTCGVGIAVSSDVLNFAEAPSAAKFTAALLVGVASGVGGGVATSAIGRKIEDSVENIK